jgi:hypothetical protein
LLRAGEEDAKREKEAKLREIERVEHERRKKIINQYLANRVGSAVMSDFSNRF